MKITTDQWTYIEIDSTKIMRGEYDEPSWLHYFGLAMYDLDGDGDLDIVSIGLDRHKFVPVWRNDGK